MVLKDENLAGIHFTGYTEVFRYMWKTVGNNIENYRTFPRLIGETGGKNVLLLLAAIFLKVYGLS